MDSSARVAVCPYSCHLPKGLGLADVEASDLVDVASSLDQLPNYGMICGIICHIGQIMSAFNGRIGGLARFGKKINDLAQFEKNLRRYCTFFNSRFESLSIFEKTYNP